MKKIFIIAGEASGDLLGAAVMHDLMQLGTYEFKGVGGSMMQEQGLQSLFPMKELSIMGLIEVLKHLPLLIKRIDQTFDAISVYQPDILVTVDSPDFCLRIAKKVKKHYPHIKTIHYVAPSVWAWRPGRAKKIAKFLDGLMCLLPFEPPYFTRHGLQAAFIGHPLTKKIQPVSVETKQQFLQRYGLDVQAPLLCVLPGSRRKEIQNLWPVFQQTVDQLRKRIPDLQIVMPTLPHLVSLLGTVPEYIRVLTDDTDKYTAFQCSTVALHASGTVALELALSGTPMVTAYKVNPITAYLAKYLVTTRYFNLVNILQGKQIVPEMLQDKANAHDLAVCLYRLLTDINASSQQKDILQTIRKELAEPRQSAAAAFIQKVSF